MQEGEGICRQGQGKYIYLMARNIKLVRSVDPSVLKQKSV